MSIAPDNELILYKEHRYSDSQLINYGVIV
jgi:hypothetical protein